MFGFVMFEKNVCKVHRASMLKIAGIKNEES